MRSTEIAGLLAPWLLASAGKVTDDCRIERITNDSRQAAPGTVFCAIRGSTRDGHTYIPQALALGARIVVQSAALPEASVRHPETAYFQVRDDYHAYAALMRAYYGFPDRSLHLTAVTGTNGKTTTVLALYQLAAEKAGVLSTVATGIGGEIWRSSEHTTPEAGELFRTLAEMRDAGCRKVYFEASSHALDQHRLGDCRIQSAIFTNLTGDHLDYHGDFESYYQAKKRLFTEYLATGAPAVIHRDGAYAERLTKELTDLSVNLHTFGNQGDVRHPVRWIASDLAGSRFTVDGRMFSTNLIGDYNVANMAGVILSKTLAGEAVPEQLDITVPGRLERQQRADGATFFVDFAHTDDALRHVLTALKPLTKGRLIVVFGAGGNRDRSKRPRMGRVAAELADRVILTSDNPRDEEPEEILREIAAGIPADIEYAMEPDRRRAIAQAVREARSNDVVVIAGKGHETTQESRGQQKHFDDREELRRELKKKKNS